MDRLLSKQHLRLILLVIVSLLLGPEFFIYLPEVMLLLESLSWQYFLLAAGLGLKPLQNQLVNQLVDQWLWLQQCILQNQQVKNALALIFFTGLLIFMPAWIIVLEVSIPLLFLFYQNQLSLFNRRRGFK